MWHRALRINAVAKAALFAADNPQMNLFSLHTLFRLSALIGLGSVLPFAYAEPQERYTNAINTSAWRTHNTVFSCQLEHTVPFYGDVVFRTRAGEASGFYLRAQTSRFRAGQGRLLAKTPVWIAEPSEEELAVVELRQGTRPLWLGAQETERMLARLNQGMEIEIEKGTWYNSETLSARLAMSTIGFKAAYEEYLRCLTGLLPRNFDQLRRSSLAFPTGYVDELPGAATRTLDQILALVKNDNKIRHFYIDGHTDSVDDRDYNLDLAKSRADLVADYLERRGIPSEWITRRWHGERYPVASNATAAGRAKNRRVTVRLERIEEIEVLPLAAELAGKQTASLSD